MTDHFDDFGGNVGGRQAINMGFANTIIRSSPRRCYFPMPYVYYRQCCFLTWLTLFDSETGSTADLTRDSTCGSSNLSSPFSEFDTASTNHGFPNGSYPLILEYFFTKKLRPLLELYSRLGHFLILAVADLSG